MGNYKYLKSEVAPSGGKLGLTRAPDCGAKVHRVVGLKSKADIRSWPGGGGTGGANSWKMLLLWRNVGRVVGRVEWRLHIGSRGHTPSRSSRAAARVPTTIVRAETMQRSDQRIRKADKVQLTLV